MLDLTTIKKSNIITPGDLKPISVKSPKITGEIMKNSTDVVSLIKNIEKYSDDNKLQIGKRIPYTIYTENLAVNVAKAYFINGEKTLCVTGWSPMGVSTQVYENGKVKKSEQDLSTYMIPADHIHCVSFGSYDPEQVKIEPPKEITISEKELEISLSELRQSLVSLDNSGWFRDFIIKAKVGMTKNYMFDKEAAPILFRNHRIVQLTQDIARMYHDKLENIIYYFLHDDKANFVLNYINDKEPVRKYRFFKTEEDRLAYIELNKSSKTGSTDKNTFTLDEVKEFAAFFENEDLTKEVEEHAEIPTPTKVTVTVNGTDEKIEVEYYEGYEPNKGVPVFQLIDLIPAKDKVKESDDEYDYVFIGISTKKDDTVALSRDSRIMESSTVYPVFKAVPIKVEEPEEEEEPPVEPEEPPVTPPTEPDPDDPDDGDDDGGDTGDGGDDNGDDDGEEEGEGGEDPDPKDPETPEGEGDGEDEGDGDDDEDDDEDEEEEKPEPEPEPEEEDEDEEDSDDSDKDGDGEEDTTEKDEQ